MDPAGGNTVRPLSPHLSIWRWHVTMASSILHRASGVALYAGAVGLALWLMMLAAGPDTFGAIEGLLGTLPGALLMYVFSVALSYHLANGFRHLVWDVGHGYDPKAADTTAWFAILFALIAPVGVFALANL